MDKLNCAIIGCGGQGGRWGRYLSKQDDLNLVACCDINADTVKAFAGKYNIPNTYTDLDMMLADKDKLRLNFVTIATPHFLHAPQTVKAANAGLHVFSEKPMATSLIECDQMIEACAKNNVKLTIGFQRRYNKDVLLAKKIIESGALGKVFQANVQALWFRTEPYYLNSTPVPENEDEDWEGWRGHWRTEGGSALINQTIHLLDGYLFMMGDLKDVQANANVTMHEYIECEDNVAATVSFQSGALGLIQAGTSYKFDSDEYHFYGTEASMHINKRGISFKGKKPSRAQIKQWKKEIGRPNSDLVMRDFLAAIRDNTTPKIPGEEGRKAIELIRAIYHSIMKEQKITIPFKDTTEHPELNRLNFPITK